MKKNRFIFPGYPFKEGTAQELARENEILRVKLKELTGKRVQIDQNEKVPVEVENAMLRSMLQFEENYPDAPEIPVYEFLGNPPYKNAEELSESEVKPELELLENLLFERNVLLDLEDMKDDLERYKYITEVFFREKIRNVTIPGVYFRFHIIGRHVPANPDDAIRESARQFITNWFNRSIEDTDGILSEHFILEEGTQLPLERVLEKFRLMFESFTAFRNWKYSFEEVKHEIKEPDLRGVGLVKGDVIYDAILESGEIQHFEGPFIIFVTLGLHGWRIFYFVFPGFKW